MKDFHKIKECVYGSFLTFFPEAHLGGEMLNLDKESKSCRRRSNRLRSGLCANRSSSSTTELFICDLYDVLCTGAQSCWKKKTWPHIIRFINVYTWQNPVRQLLLSWEWSKPGKYIRLEDKRLLINALHC